MTSPTPRHRRPAVTAQQRPPAFEIAPRDGQRHDQLIPLPSAATIPEDERHAAEQDIEHDRRSERLLVLKALLALAVVAGIAVAHSLWVG